MNTLIKTLSDGNLLWSRDNNPGRFVVGKPNQDLNNITPKDTSSYAWICIWAKDSIEAESEYFKSGFTL